MTRWWRCAAASLAIGCAVLGAVGQAKAQGSEKAAADRRARDLFTKGDAAYAEGRYEEAYGAFKEAYDLSGRAQLLYNVSNSLERLGRYEEAAAALEKYLASGKARDRDVVEKRLANLKQRVEEKKEQERVAKEERERKERDAEEKRKKELEEARKRNKPQPWEQKDEKPSVVLPAILIGTGAAALVAGGVFGVLTLGARSDAEGGCTGNLCGADARDALDREKTFGLVADIGFISGIVLGGAGIALLLTSKGPPPKRGGHGPNVALAPHGAGLGLVGTLP
jgi:tetratricopeptide (TPR) repeat protein